MTIELYPEDEEIIKTRLAKGEASSPRDLIHRAFIALPPELSHPTVMLTPEERAEAFRRWAESHNDSVVLPDEAMERANFYGE